MLFLKELRLFSMTRHRSNQSECNETRSSIVNLSFKPLGLLSQIFYQRQHQNEHNPHRLKKAENPFSKTILAFDLSQLLVHKIVSLSLRFLWFNEEDEIQAYVTQYNERPVNQVLAT